MSSTVKSLLVAAVFAATVPFIVVSPASAAPSGVPDDLELREPSSTSVVYRTEAVIAADPSRIWQLLVDLPGYKNWNPFTVRAEGDVVPGGHVETDAKFGEITVPMTHEVMIVEPERRLCWKDSGWHSWLVYNQRCRTLKLQNDGTVLFRQEMILDGRVEWTTRIMAKLLSEGVAAETTALRRRAEA